MSCPPSDDERLSGGDGLPGRLPPEADLFRYADLALGMAYDSCFGGAFNHAAQILQEVVSFIECHAVAADRAAMSEPAYQLAFLHLQSGRLQEAEETLLKALAEAVRVGGLCSAHIVPYLWTYARILRQLNRPAEAAFVHCWADCNKRN